jgi:hypothetical protein
MQTARWDRAELAKVQQLDNGLWPRLSRENQKLVQQSNHRTVDFSQG